MLNVLFQPCLFNHHTFLVKVELSKNLFKCKCYQKASCHWACCPLGNVFSKESVASLNLHGRLHCGSQCPAPGVPFLGTLPAEGYGNAFGLRDGQNSVFQRQRYIYSCPAEKKR